MVYRVIEKNTPSEKNNTTTNETVSIIAVMPLPVSRSKPLIPAPHKKTTAMPDHATKF
jgi:hypothetical protein